MIACAEEEKFSRKKHDFGFPWRAIDFVLKKGDLDASDLDYVVFYEKPFVKFERILMSIFQTYPRSLPLFRESMAAWFGDKLWIKNSLCRHLNIEEERVLFSEHHMSHAASAFFCSPFDEAAVLTVDGVGEWATATMGTGKGTEIKVFKEIPFPHSLGLLFSAFTAFLGFEVNEGEYKVMGLAPYGRPLYADKVKKLISVARDGSFQLDMDYFSFHYSLQKTFNRRFESLFGPPRKPDAPFFTAVNPLPSKAAPGGPVLLSGENQRYADIAASIQSVLEETLLSMASALHKETRQRRLCLAGGVGLNGVANFRLLKETSFEEIYVHPAAGDSGGAVGAALYAWHMVLGHPRSFVMEHAFWGQDYGDAAIGDFIRLQGVPAEKLEDEGKLIGRVVDLMAQGKVVGWFQGRFEWGPRALGNRSILADPRREEMKNIVNMKIKFREPFRPFAPSVIVEKIPEYFDRPDLSRQYPTRFMLYVVPVREGKRAAIPAVTHVDGSARLHGVSDEHAPLFHRLISAFGEATGVPVVLNTSFNLKGEPIVNSPQDAFSTFTRSGMDALVMGNWVIEKGRT